MSALTILAVAAVAQASPPPAPRPVAPPPVVHPLAPPAPPAPPPPPPRAGQPARPVMPLIYYFTEDDYPASALRADEQGTTAFRLDVSPEGRVTGCTVTASSGSAALDSATCRILRARARYRPATDAGGRPVAGSHSGRARWVLPPEPSATVPDIELLPAPPAMRHGQAVQHPRPLAPLPSLFAAADYPAEALAAPALGQTGLELVVGVDGGVAGCATLFSSGVAALDRAACRVLRERARFAPARDAFQGPVPGRLLVRISWRPEPDEAEGEGEGEDEEAEKEAEAKAPATRS